MISGSAMSGVRDLFNLKANQPASLVTKAPAGWKGEKDVCFPVGVFSVAPADLTLGLVWFSRWGPGMSWLSGLTSTKAGRSNSVCGAIYRCQGVLSLCFGRAHCCVWSCPAVFWAAQGAGPSPCLALGSSVSWFWSPNSHSMLLSNIFMKPPKHMNILLWF